METERNTLFLLTQVASSFTLETLSLRSLRPSICHQTVYNPIRDTVVKNTKSPYCKWRQKGCIRRLRGRKSRSDPKLFNFCRKHPRYPLTFAKHNFVQDLPHYCIRPISPGRRPVGRRSGQDVVFFRNVDTRRPTDRTESVWFRCLGRPVSPVSFFVSRDTRSSSFGGL